MGRWVERGIGEEARACGRAVPYHSGTTGPMEAGATHGTPLVLSLDRADVGSRAWGVNIAQVFIAGQGVGGSIRGPKCCTA